MLVPAVETLSRPPSKGTAQIAAKISFNDGAADLGLLPISDF
jgi:hypothetical protein